MSGLKYAGTTGGFTGNLSDYIQVENVFKDIGLAGREALAVHGENITWLSESKRGIYQLRRSAEGKVLGRDVSLSEKIQPLMDRIHWAYAHKACATFYNNYLLFAVPLGEFADKLFHMETNRLSVEFIDFKTATLARRRMISAAEARIPNAKKCPIALRYIPYNMAIVGQFMPEHVDLVQRYNARRRQVQLFWVRSGIA